MFIIDSTCIENAIITYNIIYYMIFQLKCNDIKNI